MYLGKQGKKYGTQAYEYTKTDEFKEKWSNTKTEAKSIAGKLGVAIKNLFTVTDPNQPAAAADQNIAPSVPSAPAYSQPSTKK